MYIKVFKAIFVKGSVMILVGIICTQNMFARMRAKLFFLLYKNYIYIFFSFSVWFCFQPYFPLCCFLLFLLLVNYNQGFGEKRIYSSIEYIALAHYTIVYVLPIEKNCMKYLESSESTYIKSQNDRPSPKIPHERVAQILRFLREFVNLRVAQPVVKIHIWLF